MPDRGKLSPISTELFKKNSSENTASGGILSRRQLFRRGGAWFCLLCLAGIYGCVPEDDVTENEKPAPSAPGAQTAQKGLIKTQRSPWYTELSGEKVRCDLCPHQCELANGERAPCRVRENRDGALYSLVYGNPALVQEDPVERKPFFHVLQGTRALSVSTAGCNLYCKFCEVWDMALVKPEELHAYEMPPEKVLQHAKTGGVEAISYAFGEPVIYYEYVTSVAKQAKDAGLLNLMHTAAYINPDPLKEILPLMDAVNVDLKGFEEDFYREYVGGELKTILSNLKIIREMGVHLEITNIVIPSLNDDPEKIGRMCEWIRDELGTEVPLHFVRFYPLYRLSALPRTPVSTMDEVRNTALESGLKYVYVSRVTGHDGENTFCPECEEKIIERKGFVIENLQMDEGKCGFCGAEVPGHWIPAS